MGRQEEFERLDRTIKDTEIRIRTMQSHIVTVDKELVLLETTQTELLENIKCLKAKEVVPRAQEFKRSKEDLNRTKNRINILSADKDVFTKSIADLEENLLDAKKDLEKLEKVEDNVLTFGKKNG